MQTSAHSGTRNLFFAEQLDRSKINPQTPQYFYGADILHASSEAISNGRTLGNGRQGRLIASGFCLTCLLTRRDLVLERGRDPNLLVRSSIGQIQNDPALRQSSRPLHHMDYREQCLAIRDCSNVGIGAEHRGAVFAGNDPIFVAVSSTLKGSRSSENGILGRFSRPRVENCQTN